MKNNLKNRNLTNEAKEIIIAYFVGDIDFITAHNKLLSSGIYLTENDELVDY